MTSPLRERPEDLLQHLELLVEGRQLGLQRGDAATLRGDAVVIEAIWVAGRPPGSGEASPGRGRPPLNRV